MNVNSEQIVLFSYFITLILIGITSTTALLTSLAPPQRNYKLASFYFAAAIGIPPLLGSLVMTGVTPNKPVYNLVIFSIMFIGIYFFQRGYALRSQKKPVKKKFIIIHYFIFIFGLILSEKIAPTGYEELTALTFQVLNFIFISLLILPVVKHISHTKPSYGEIANYLSIIITIILMVMYPLALYYSGFNRFNFVARVLPLQVLQVHIWVITILVLMLSDLVELYRFQAKIDAMTQLSKREHFFEQSNNLIKEHKQAYIIFCDIDYFKKINDTYGHSAGDKVIIAFAKLLTDSLVLQKFTSVGRLGGEEFAICIAGCSLNSTIEIANLLRKKTEKLGVKYEEHVINFTSSFGVAVVEDDFDKALKNADDSLYHAKNSGRNQVHIHTNNGD